MFFSTGKKEINKTLQKFNCYPICKMSPLGPKLFWSKGTLVHFKMSFFINYVSNMRIRWYQIEERYREKRKRDKLRRLRKFYSINQQQFGYNFGFFSQPLFYIDPENTKLTGNDTIPLSTWKTCFKKAVLHNNNKISVIKNELN